jgi:hypothetical protein
MKKVEAYEDFPLWIPLVFLLFSILGYMIGAVILVGFGVIIAFMYLVYCFGLELLVIFRSCRNCYYYGKLCGVGKGKIAQFFVKKGDSTDFANRKIGFFDLIPDFLVVIFPVVGGIILSVLDFSFIRIFLIIILLLLFFAGNALLRGSFACRFCRQKELGCPAEELFFKEKTDKPKLSQQD